MKTLLISFCFIALLTSVHNQTFADFTFTEEIALNSPLTTPYGIAFDGTNWHISDGATFGGQTFATFDTDFNFINEVSVPLIEEMRGLTFDSNSGNLFVSSHENGLVAEVLFDGTVVSQFSTSFSFGGLTGIAYNSLDDTIWISSFGGTIQNVSRTGQLLSSFETGAINDWTGIALDQRNNSLLLITANDTIFEYGTDGSLIQQVLTQDIIQGNGLGLAYDSDIGRLFVTSQLNNTVTILDDPSRVPEPGSALLLLLAFGTVATKRRR